MNTEFRTSITADEVNALPIAQVHTPILVLDNHSTDQDILAAATRLATEPVIGLDTETKPSFVKGKPNKVALLQLSTPAENILVRLCTFQEKSRLTPIQGIIENSNIIKAGVAIHEDARSLVQHLGWSPRAILELTEMSTKAGIKVSALNKIYAILFGLHMTKKQRLSNWERDTLTDTQIGYAALDARAGLDIFKVLYPYYTPTMLRNHFPQHPNANS